MRLLPLLLLTVLHRALPALSVSLLLALPPTPAIPNPSSLPASSTHARLTRANVTLSTPLQRSPGGGGAGAAAFFFLFRDVPPGSYLCDVYARDFAFAPLRVDVGDDGGVEAWRTFRGNGWDDRGERVADGSGGVVEVDVGGLLRGGREFYEARGGFNPLSLLKSPMILIGVVGLAIVFGMPKMMESMDPEMREEFEKQQRSNPLTSLTSGNPAGGFDMAGWMAGSGTTEKKSTAVEGPSTGKAARRRG